MNRVQEHRGRDGEGVLTLSDSGVSKVFYNADVSLVAEAEKARIALGHRRLAIQDTSDAGLQPMTLGDSGSWICFNGEVYNFLELRSELISKGYSFRTRSDTEVILAAWEAWGEDCFRRFNGMWSMAIWDGDRRKLILSRDRLGIKPLYYSVQGSALYFGSEIKSILATGEVDSVANEAVILAYLKYGVVDFSNDTFFRHIHAFPPGHFAVVDWDAPERISPVCYWSLEDLGIHDPGSFDAAVEEFSQLIHSSVELRNRSDVPVGSCLSGGLDSSTLVGILSGMRNTGMNTYTSASSIERFDERKWSDLVVETFATSSNVDIPSEEGFLTELDDLLRFHDEPFTTASIYAQYSLMRLARKTEVPVLLDGQGADEVLCGYRKYYFFHIKNLLGKGRFLQAASALVNLLRFGDRGFLRWWEGARYLPSALQFNASPMEGVLGDTFRERYEAYHLPLGSNTTILDRQKDDVLRFSVPSLLRYEDRNSMAFSIESRVPFLDHRIVEYLCQLPVHYKLYKGRTKEVLRRAMAGILPLEILERRDKMGFVTPQELWIKGELGKRIQERFHSSDFGVGLWIDQHRLCRRFDSFLRDGSRAGHLDFFRIFLLDRWMEMFDVKTESAS